MLPGILRTRIVLLPLLIVLAHVGAVHGAQDAPDLMQTLVAKDATLNNELDLIEMRWVPGRDRRELALGFGVEKIVANNLALEVTSEWEDISSHSGASGNGFGKIDFELKYVLWTYPENEFQIALTPAISARTSSHIGDDNLSNSAAIGISWGGRLSFLKDAGWERYLRAVELQGDLAYSRALGASSADALYFDPVIDYSLPYLSYTSAPEVPWPLRNLCIFAEFNFYQPLSSPNDGAHMFLTPGVSYLNNYLQLSAGLQIALNRTTSSSEKIALIGSASIFLDALDPVFARTLF